MPLSPVVRRGLVAALLAVSISAVSLAGADEPAKLLTDKAEKTDTTQKLEETKKAKVVGVDPQEFSLRGVIVVKTQNLPKDRPAKDWRLYLDGVPLKGLPPENEDVEQTGELRFRLDRNEKSKEAWSKLLRGAELSRPVRVGLGTEEKFDASIGQLEEGATLVIKQLYRLIAIVVAVLAIVAVLYLAGKKTVLLRTRAIGSPANQLPPFSLGLTQMAFWFVLVLAGYLYIAVVTWNLTEAIPGSLLVLLGISAATAFGAVGIDADKRDRREKLEAERTQLVQQQSALEGRVAVATASELPMAQEAVRQNAQRVAEITTALTTLPPQTASPRGFFLDLVSDAEGISLHRLQLVIWTLVFGAVFISEVYQKLAMPVFSETMLTLIGISSGSYIGFKFPEKKA